MRCVRFVLFVGFNGGMDERLEGMEEDGVRVVEMLKVIMSIGWRGEYYFFYKFYIFLYLYIFYV